jgi:hypothetical protein
MNGRQMAAPGVNMKHSVQVLSSRPLPKNVQTKIHKTIILPVVLYGYATWSLTLREEHRLKVSEEDIWGAED